MQASCMVHGSFCCLPLYYCALDVLTLDFHPKLVRFYEFILNRHIQTTSWSTFLRRYVSTMDFHPKLGMLLCTGLVTPGNTPSYLAAFAASEPNGFVPRGFIMRPLTSQACCIRVGGWVGAWVGGCTRFQGVNPSAGEW